MDVTGIEPVTPCLQSRPGKTLTALSGVAYTEISEIPALSNVPKLYRTANQEPDCGTKQEKSLTKRLPQY